MNDTWLLEHDAHMDAILKNMNIEIFHIPVADEFREVEGTDAVVRLCADRPPLSALMAAASPTGRGFSGVHY